MPLVLGDGWYVYEDVVASGEAEFRWSLDYKMGHFARQDIGLFDEGLAVLVRGDASVAEDVFEDVAEEWDEDPDPELFAVQTHDEKPWDGEHVEPVEDLEVAASAYEWHGTDEYDHEHDEQDYLVVEKQKRKFNKMIDLSFRTF